MKDFDFKTKSYVPIEQRYSFALFTWQHFTKWKLQFSLIFLNKALLGMKVFKSIKIDYRSLSDIFPTVYYSFFVSKSSFFIDFKVN